MCTYTIIVLVLIAQILVVVVVVVVIAVIFMVVKTISATITITITITVTVVVLPKSVFIVVHPDFEHTSVDPNVAAELVDQLFVPLLHLPPNSLCQFVHPLLLILGEFCSESLPPTGIRSCRAGRGGH